MNLMKSYSINLIVKLFTARLLCFQKHLCSCKYTVGRTAIDSMTAHLLDVLLIGFQLLSPKLTVIPCYLILLLYCSQNFLLMV